MATASDHLQSDVVSRLMWRLMPFLFLLYVVAYLDRINVGFGVLQMRGQLGLSERVIGRAGGMFFIGYFLFQVPSNLVLERVGVRRWISALMIAWGIVSCLMVFIRGPLSFYGLRFLLGATEAGFFPGIILHMKRWFPARARGRAVAWFMTANPLAGVIGSPISGALLSLRGQGLSGWQWMFLIEGLPAIILGLIVLRTLADTPHEAHWMTDAERAWLLDALAQEQQAEASVPLRSIWGVLLSGRIWLLSMVYFGVSTAMYGLTLWLPSVIHALSGLSYFWTSVVAILPFLVTTVAMVLIGAHSDRKAERRWHTAIPAFAAAAGLLLAAFGTSAGIVATGFATVVVVIGISIGLAFSESMVGPFWAMTTQKLQGLSAAAGIAAINSLANLGGYFGPDIVGFFRAKGGFGGGLLAIGATLALSGTIALIVGRSAAE